MNASKLIYYLIIICKRERFVLSKSAAKILMETPIADNVYA